MAEIDDLKRISKVEFDDIVKRVYMTGLKLRIILTNNSFIDCYLSRRLPDKFGYHWECMDDQKTIYRYDNFPDKNWISLETYPYHFHKGSQQNVEAPPFPTDIINGFRAFMEFVREKLRTPSV
jgi:hypothetical protein